LSPLTKTGFAFSANFSLLSFRLKSLIRYNLDDEEEAEENTR